MIRYSFRILIVVTGVFVAACGAGSSGSDANLGLNDHDSQTRSENHSQKTQENYIDASISEPENARLMGPMKFKRVFSMELNFFKSEGLSDFTKDLSLKIGTGHAAYFSGEQSQDCVAGASVASDSKLFKKVNYQQVDEREEEVPGLSFQNSVFLEKNSYYFIRTHFKVNGQCTSLKAKIQVEIHY